MKISTKRLITQLETINGNLSEAMSCLELYTHGMDGEGAIRDAHKAIVKAYAKINKIRATIAMESAK